MTKNIFLGSLLCVSVFLVSCAPKMVPTGSQIAETTVSSDVFGTAIDFNTSIPSRTSTASNTKIPSMTSSPSATVTVTWTATPESTYTPTLFPSPIPGVSQQCIFPTEDAVPADMVLRGTIALVGALRKISESYVLNLETGEQIGLPGEAMQVFNNGAVSPDRKWFAYMGTESTSEGRIQARNLVLINSNGILEKKIDLSTIIAPVTYAGFIDWLDNERLILRWFAGESASPEETTIVILNPFTGEQQELKPNYPNLFDRYPDFNYKWGEYWPILSVYNREFDRVIYLSHEGVVLYDLSSQQQIKLFEDETIFNISQPVWFPDGSRFILDLDSSSGRNLYIVSKDGTKQQVTFLSGHDGFGTNMGDYSDFTWSPNGSSIAFWLMTGRDWNTGDNSYDLSVLDLSTKQIRNLCIPVQICRSNYPEWYPVWSPDGTKLLVAVPYGACSSVGPMSQSSNTVLIDLADNKAYLLAEDVVPLGWMQSE